MALHSGLSAQQASAVRSGETAAAGASSEPRKPLFVCVCEEDNVLIIKSGRNNHFDSVHWQGGGTLMTSSECWGIYSSRVTHAHASRCSTWGQAAKLHLSPAPSVPHLLNICSNQTSCGAMALRSCMPLQDLWKWEYRSRPMAKHF